MHKIALIALCSSFAVLFDLPECDNIVRPTYKYSLYFETYESTKVKRKLQVLSSSY